MATGLRLLLLVLALVGTCMPVAEAQTRTPVTVFEAWFIHNESMGAPTAVEQGFFGPLAVKVAGGGPGQSPIERVMAETRRGGIAFGVDSAANLLTARAREKLPLVAVAHDFQHSALRLLSWKALASARDIEGPVGTWVGYDTPLKAAVGPDWPTRITIVTQQGDPATLGGWLRKDYPVAHAMSYNELLIATRAARDRFWQYSFADFGIDWPENVVFTTEDTLRQHPTVVQVFVTGRYRGFRHALANRDEAVRTLLRFNENLNGQEAHERAGMDAIATLVVTPASRQNGLGWIDPAAWERVGRDLVRAGLAPAPLDVTAAYTRAFPSGVTP